MPAARQRTPPAPPKRLWTTTGFHWLAVADALGHSILVFVFLPTLAALPDFLGYELRNPFNLTDPVVLAFLPARTLRAFVNAFSSGVIPGSIAGAVNTALLCAMVWLRPAPAGAAQRMALGAVCGVVAGLLSVLAILAIQFGRAGITNAPWVAIAFETASATVCGMVAGPGAVRLLLAGADDAAANDVSVRR